MIINNKNFHSIIENSRITGPRIFRKKARHLYNASKFCSVDGMVLEFGVGWGHSINAISKIFKDDIVYGFDSFQGLPEPWEGPTDIPDTVGKIVMSQMQMLNHNVTLVEGWFSESLPVWIKEVKPTTIKYMHLDCNLYSSSITVLMLLNDYIVPGTVICFDEFYLWDDPEKWTTWQKGEYRALFEWVSKYDRKFEILFYGDRNELSIKIKS